MVKLTPSLLVSASNYREYRLYYNATHRNVWTRRLHAAGIFIAVVCAFVSALSLDFRFLIAGVLAGYGISWAGDVLLESRKPASLDHPIWALQAHCDMVKGMITKEKSLIN